MTAGKVVQKEILKKGKNTPKKKGVAGGKVGHEEIQVG